MLGSRKTTARKPLPDTQIHGASLNRQGHAQAFRSDLVSQVSSQSQQTLGTKPWTSFPPLLDPMVFKPLPVHVHPYLRPALPCRAYTPSGPPPFPTASVWFWVLFTFLTVREMIPGLFSTLSHLPPSFILQSLFFLFEFVQIKKYWGPQSSKGVI